MHAKLMERLRHAITHTFDRCRRLAQATQHIKRRVRVELWAGAARWSGQTRRLRDVRRWRPRSKFVNPGRTIGKALRLPVRFLLLATGFLCRFLLLLSLFGWLLLTAPFLLRTWRMV